MPGRLLVVSEWLRRKDSPSNHSLLPQCLTAWGFFMEVLMGICAVSHDLAVYEAQVDAAEAEEEFYNGVAADLIAEFEEEGACRVYTGPRQADFKDYDQSHLLESLFSYERCDLATECFRMALDSSCNREIRNAAALAFFNLAEEQMHDDLNQLAVEEYQDDEYCP